MPQSQTERIKRTARYLLLIRDGLRLIDPGRIKIPCVKNHLSAIQKSRGDKLYGIQDDASYLIAFCRKNHVITCSHDFSFYNQLTAWVDFYLTYPDSLNELRIDTIGCLPSDIEIQSCYGYVELEVKDAKAKQVILRKLISVCVLANRNTQQLWDEIGSTTAEMIDSPPVVSACVLEVSENCQDSHCEAKAIAPDLIGIPEGNGGCRSGNFERISIPPHLIRILEADGNSNEATSIASDLIDILTPDRYIPYSSIQNVCSEENLQDLKSVLSLAAGQYYGKPQGIGKIIAMIDGQSQTLEILRALRDTAAEKVTQKSCFGTVGQSFWGTRQLETQKVYNAVNEFFTQQRGEKTMAALIKAIRACYRPVASATMSAGV